VFTGALVRKLGRFEAANGGRSFLTRSVTCHWNFGRSYYGYFRNFAWNGKEALTGSRSTCV
jgi:hypothetical protein